MNNLRKFRKAKGLTQQELAQEVGLPFNTFISKCELGYKKLPYDLAVKIAKVLNCDVYELMGDDIYRKDIAAKLEEPKPMGYEQAKELFREKFGTELNQEAYDLILEIGGHKR